MTRSRANTRAIVVGIVMSIIPFSILAETDQPGSEPIVIGQKYALRSEVLNEEREYIVYLPMSYTASKYAERSYPVLFLLDGGPLFPSTSGIVQYMSSNINGNTQIPELIVVAIPNTNRTRDLTPTHTMLDGDGNEYDGFAESGGGNKFLQFFEDELFPEIDSKYRTMPHRTIAGNSFGGLLTLYAMISKRDLFQAYIANDPSLWWDRGVVIRLAHEAFQSDRSSVHSVYISSSHDENDGMKSDAQEMVGILSGEAASGVRVEFQYFDSEDHGSLYLPGMYHGLQHVFEGYDISFDDVYEQPQKIVEHFNSFSKNLGIEYSPPESILNNWGHFMLHQLEMSDEALEMFEINAANYPDSANVYYSLGELYSITGEEQLTIESLEKSLELDPNHHALEWTNKTLDELRK